MRTTRLELRPLAEEDLDDLVALDGFTVIRQAIDPFGDLIPRDLTERRDYQRRLLDREDFHAAVELATGRFLGWFQAQAVGDPPREVELGYRIRPDAWGRGYASEGAEALLAAALRRPDVQRVYAHALLSNPASIRVMDKIGMRYVRPWAYRGLPGVEYEARPAREASPYEGRSARARPRQAERKSRSSAAVAEARPAQGATRPMRQAPERTTRLAPHARAGSRRPSQAAQRAERCALRRRERPERGARQGMSRAGTAPARPERGEARRALRCG